MQKLYSLLSGLFLVVLTMTLSGLQAQNVQLQSSTFPSLPATSCTNTMLDVTVLKLCINMVHNGNSFNISGNTITVTLDYTLGPICLGAISMGVESINLGNIPAGSYTVVINAVLNSSIASTLTSSLVVNSCCSALPGFTPSRTTICVGDSIYFANTSTGANSQQWYENNTSVGTSTDYGKRYNAVGSYSIKLVVNGTGCTDSVTKTVTVTAPPVVDLGPDLVICPGSQTVLDAGGGRDSINWSDQSTFRSLVVTSPGTYYVEVFKNGCSDIDTTVVSFFNVQDLDLGNDTTICLGDTLVLDATLAGTSYKWQDNSTGSTFKVFAAGKYSVTRTDSNGCKARDTINVSVDVNCNTSDLFETYTFNEVITYPNPVKNVLSVDLPRGESRQFELEVFDVSGKNVVTQKVKLDVLGQLSIDVSFLRSGIYTLRLIGKGEIYTSRWVKE